MQTSSKIVTVLAVLTLLIGNVTRCRASDKKLPKLAIVRAAFEAHFAPRTDYASGDVISQRDVKPIFEQLDALGWQVAERDVILKLVSLDQAFIATQLRTREGRKFMRKVKGQALVYDRLDRLSRMPGGRKLIVSMTTIPKGDQLMGPKPTPGLRDLTQLLPKGRNGKTPVDKDFHKPTGMIYTQDALWKHINKSYVKATSSLAGV